jgi:hypothetical protein
VPVFLDAKVFLLHPHDGVDGVRERLGAAQTAFLRLMAHDERDAVADRFA